MKIPKKIKVGPFVYAVTCDKVSFDNYGLAMRDLDALGYNDQRSASIHISPGLTPTVEREVVLHEAIHSIYSTAGLNITVGREHEETIVYAISVGLLQLIRDNHSLVQYLQEKD